MPVNSFSNSLKNLVINPVVSAGYLAAGAVRVGANVVKGAFTDISENVRDTKQKCFEPMTTKIAQCVFAPFQILNSKINPRNDGDYLPNPDKLKVKGPDYKVKAKKKYTPKNGEHSPKEGFVSGPALKFFKNQLRAIDKSVKKDQENVRKGLEENKILAPIGNQLKALGKKWVISRLLAVGMAATMPITRLADGALAGVGLGLTAVTLPLAYRWDFTELHNFTYRSLSFTRIVSDVTFAAQKILWPSIDSNIVYGQGKMPDDTDEEFVSSTTDSTSSSQKEEAQSKLHQKETQSNKDIKKEYHDWSISDKFP